MSTSTSKQSSAKSCTPEFRIQASKYGAPRMLKALVAIGYKIGKEKVAEIMREKGLKAKALRKYRAATTDSKHKYPLAENKLV